VELNLDEGMIAECSQIRSTVDQSFVLVGFPGVSRIGLFNFDSKKFNLNLNKWLEVDFRVFEVDLHCTQLLLMNPK